MNIIKKSDWIAPFKYGFPKDFKWKEKIIGIVYFPTIIIMWYGYYMWNQDKLTSELSPQEEQND